MTRILRRASPHSHRHTNHVPLHRESQRLTSHSNAHRQHKMNELSQRDNTGAAGAKGEALMHAGGGVALARPTTLTRPRHYEAEERRAELQRSAVHPFRLRTQCCLTGAGPGAVILMVLLCIASRVTKGRSSSWSCLCWCVQNRPPKPPPAWVCPLFPSVKNRKQGN